MCGIVGYLGPQDATPIVFDGLKSLEYRGYDSAGIALLHETDTGLLVQLRRSVGKLANLGQVLLEEPATGTVGIGHTRWATHGRPSNTNAHPHVDCRGETVVVHNGIVENYRTLKQRLIAQGHTFASETDTEVIVHLVEQYLTDGLSLECAVRATLGQLEGNHAIVVLSKREPDRLIAARIGNAGGVVIGVGDGEMFIASDLPAILKHTRKVAFLDDHEIAVVTRDSYRFTRLDGTEVDRAPQMVNWDAVSAAKGGYKHFMLKEIHEQPRAITDTIAGRITVDPPGVRLDDFLLTDDMLREVNRIVIVACGTAWHAGLIGKFMLEELAKLPVEVDYADEFRYRQPLLDKKTLMLAITQSGETVDLLVSMAEAKRQGVSLVGIVNVVGSQATRLADSVVYTRAGPEIGVASTKAFTSQLAALYLFALKLGQARGVLTDEVMTRKLEAIQKLPRLVADILADQTPYQELANHYYKREDFLYLGRGINYPIALEGALKLKEISYIHAEGYPAGEMKHGPIALIDELMPVVAFLPNDRVYDKMLSNVEQVKARGGVLIAIATEGDDLIGTKADHVLYVPATDPHLTPIVNAIPLQLLAYHMAVKRGCDVDQPRNLAKSVTVE
jgi:glutamine---fructose-6-phosphate transaminase (isomerizing)